MLKTISLLATAGSNKQRQTVHWYCCTVEA